MISPPFDHPWALLALIGAGLLAGFVNTLAGGGSLLTLPALMLFGMPADVANATNRVAVVAQSATGAHGFYRQGVLPVADIPRVLLPVVTGGALGAAAASAVPVFWLKPVLLSCLLAVGVYMAWGVRAPRAVEAHRRSSGRAAIGLFLAGAYGGFVQAGVGFILLATLSGTMGFGMARANALKVVCAFAFTSVALLIFAWSGSVEWVVGGVLALASSTGARLGVRFATRVPDGWIRAFVLGCLIASCVAISLQP